MLTHIFTPADCARCKLCCNFCRSSAWETPALEPRLAQHLQTHGVPLEQRADGACTFHLHFVSTDPQECANCPVLDPEKGCSLPREQRPFECRIWPLRLMHGPLQQTVLGLYQACPALTPDVRQKLIAEATGPLLPSLLAYARQYPLAVRPMHPAYDIVWQPSNE